MTEESSKGLDCGLPVVLKGDLRETETEGLM